MPFVLANGIQVYYEVFGAGEQLVVINGLGIELSEFGVITKSWAERFQVLVFDNRGAGRSDKPDLPYTIGMLATDTAELMQATGFVDASVVGISLGGRIALELSLQRPDLVKQLVLVSTGARVPPSRTRTLMTGWPLQLISRGKYPQPRYAFLRQRAASTNYDATDRLGEISVPTLIVHGRQDRLAPLRVAGELHEGIAGSTLVTFKGGHLFFLIRERQHFLKTVEGFLAP